jgi:type III secretion protein C
MSTPAFRDRPPLPSGIAACLKSWLLRALPYAVVFAALVAALPSHAEPPPWPDSPYSYMVHERQLDRMLAGFAKSFGLELRLETALPDGLEAMNGRTTAANPTEFLNSVGAACGLSWYYHAGVLYVSRTSDRITRMIPTKGMSGEALKKAFTEMGLLNPKFGWGSVDERSAVMVSGPRTYVQRIEQAMADFPEPAADQQILVFRLQHAAVNDRTIMYRDKEIVTPGVATMLRNLLGDSSNSGGAGGTFTQLANPLSTMQSMPPLVDATARNAKANAQDRADVKTAAGQDTTRRTQPRVTIQADARLNAILIKDRPQNAPLYAQLIEMLDVPTHVIEIEAAIVDVNANSMKELGIDWNGRVGKVAGGFGIPGAAPDATTLTLVRGANVNPTTVIADAGNFIMTRIKLLEGKGSAHIVARPFILTQENMGALFDLSDTFYVQTSGEQVATVTPISVGVTLRVTPRLVDANGRRSIELVVDIEDGSIQDTKIGELPTVRRNVIGTQAVIGENESLLIGGFNTEQKLQQKDGVPVLGDLPVLGTMFSKTTSSTQKQERMFLITPKIITQPFDMAQAVAVEAGGLRLERTIAKRMP